MLLASEVISLANFSRISQFNKLSKFKFLKSKKYNFITEMRDMTFRTGKDANYFPFFIANYK